MQKYKLQRSADCIVGGFRYGKNTMLVGSLLLGLYNRTACWTMSALRPPCRRATSPR